MAQRVYSSKGLGNEQEQMEVPGTSLLYAHSPEGGELSISSLKALLEDFQVTLTNLGIIWIFTGIGKSYGNKPSLVGTEGSPVDTSEAP